MIAARWQSFQRIAPQAWPFLVGQLAVLAYATADTLLIARYAATDLAALAVGTAIYMTVFIGLMGVVMAVAPIVGQHFGAKRHREAGDTLHQGVWLALGVLVVGEALLLYPDPLLAISQTAPDVEAKIRAYLHALALALPAGLLFTAYRSFNMAVSRPKAVMVLQVGGLLVKLPLSALLIYGLPSLGIPSLGVQGCGIATAAVLWVQLLLGFTLLRRDAFYAQFGLHTGGLHPPRPAVLKRLLRLGIPQGGSIMIEVTGFTFMAIFIARLGTTAVAGHQLTTNLVTLCFMVPLALSNATGTLVAQRVGAHDHDDARRLGWHGLQIALALAFVMGGALFFGREQVLGLYTHDPAIVQAALPLLVWAWIFHFSDAGQTLAAAILRAHHVATMPMVIYALAIWGLGLGGGYQFAFGGQSWVPSMMQGAAGFWAAAALGLSAAASALVLCLAWVHKVEIQAGLNKV